MLVLQLFATEANQHISIPSLAASYTSRCRRGEVTVSESRRPVNAHESVDICAEVLGMSACEWHAAP